MATTALNKVLDLGLAVVMMRVLGPEDVGRYAWAVLVVGYFDILVNFGLGVLITRDVARAPDQAPRYLGGALLTRSALWGISLVAAVAIAGPLAMSLELTPDMGLALVVLTLGIGISNLAGIVSALFSARERFEYPALVTVFSTALKVSLGVVALGLGYGIVGLAMVSVVVNLATALILVVLLYRYLGAPHIALDVGFSLRLVALSYPLMLNNLLATVFFRIDGLILRGVSGDTALGWYSAAYRFIDGLNLIPSSLTLALFPVLSRLAAEAQPTAARTPNSDAAAPASHLRHDALLRPATLALRLLLALALPMAAGTTILAEPIIRLLAGDAFLPYAAWALQVLIWFLPFSFTNGLLQYVLIAANQQRFVTVAFVIAVGFNVTANLILVPAWSYLGAAVVTVLSEVVLLGPFWWGVQRHVGRVGLLSLAWRPALAAGAMSPLVWLLRDVPILAIPAGTALYSGVLLALGGITAQDRDLLRRALPR